MKHHHENHLIERSTMTTFEPGTPVWHPTKQYGRVLKPNGNFGPTIVYFNGKGAPFYTEDFDGWERARTAGPDEVVIKVDDLDLSDWVNTAEPGYSTATKAAIRAANAWAELQKDASRPASDLQRDTDAESELAESSQKDERPQRVKAWADEVWVKEDETSLYRCETDPTAMPRTYEDLKTTLGPLTILDAEPEPAQDGQPTTTEVSLPCPDCGEQIIRTVFVEKPTAGKYTLGFVPSDKPVGERAHACKPAQPDEPQDAGVKVTLGTQRLIGTDRMVDGWRIFINVDDGRSWDWRDIAWIAQRDNEPLHLGWDE